MVDKGYVNGAVDEIVYRAVQGEGHAHGRGIAVAISDAAAAPRDAAVAASADRSVTHLTNRVERWRLADDAHVGHVDDGHLHVPKAAA